MRQAKNASTRRPRSERRRIDLCVNPLGLHDVGQVDKADLLQGTLEGLGDNLRVGFDEIRQRRPRQKT